MVLKRLEDEKHLETEALSKKKHEEAGFGKAEQREQKDDKPQTSHDLLHELSQIKPEYDTKSN